VSLVSWIGVFVSFIGLALITLLQITDFEFNTGVILLICCAVLFGLFNIVVRKLTQTYTALEVTVYTILFGSITNLIFTPHFLREVSDSTLAVNLLVVFMGVAISAGGFFTWSYALAKAEKTAHITVFAYLIPFMAAIIAFFWLQETLSVYTFVGGIIIIAGMLMTNLFGKRRVDSDGRSK
jgi:drug/metabolite transporter (DMT)-like permease